MKYYCSYNPCLKYDIYYWSRWFSWSEVFPVKVNISLLFCYSICLLHARSSMWQTLVLLCRIQTAFILTRARTSGTPCVVITNDCGNYSMWIVLHMKKKKEIVFIIAELITLPLPWRLIVYWINLLTPRVYGTFENI